jgi:hypothetical protein
MMIALEQTQNNVFHNVSHLHSGGARRRVERKGHVRLCISAFWDSEYASGRAEDGINVGGRVQSANKRETVIG